MQAMAAKFMMARKWRSAARSSSFPAARIATDLAIKLLEMRSFFRVSLLLENTECVKVQGGPKRERAKVAGCSPFTAAAFPNWQLVAHQL